MNALQVFENDDFGQVRTIEIDGKILFCGKDVATSLGYAVPKDAVAQHCKGAVKHRIPTNGGLQNMLFISESDLYRLIVNSKLPAAERFESWVFDTVLPTIRQTGGYVKGNEMDFIVKSVVTEIMTQIPVIVAETVKATLNSLQISESSKPVYDEKSSKKPRINYHGKIDKLPSELRNEVIVMIFEKKYTYIQVSNNLKEKGHDIHFSSVHRYAKRVIDELNRNTGIEIQG